jgi:hypothetical protein
MAAEAKTYVKSKWCVINHRGKIKVMPGIRQFRDAYQTILFQHDDLITCDQECKKLEKDSNFGT